MYSLEPRRVEKPRRVAEDHPSVARDRRNRPPAAVGHRLRSVANHLATLKQLGDKGMPLELLQHPLRIEPWIGIVEPGPKPEQNHIVVRPAARRPENPPPTIFFGGERPPHGVNHFARRDA